MTQAKQKQELQPPQHQDHRPGSEAEMTPKPQAQGSNYRAAGKLEGKVALITGGDSGIDRSVAILYAKEGADVAILYFSEDQDAAETKRLVEAGGKRCILIKGDGGDESVCQQA